MPETLVETVAGATPLADRIERAISKIPASNPGLIAPYQQTVRDVLSRELLREIAKVAAKTARADVR